MNGDIHNIMLIPRFVEPGVLVVRGSEILILLGVKLAFEKEWLGLSIDVQGKILFFAELQLSNQGIQVDKTARIQIFDTKIR